MANYVSSPGLEEETEALAPEDGLDEDFDFDEEEDDFMEKSQRRLLQAKRGRVPRRGGDWD